MDAMLAAMGVLPAASAAVHGLSLVFFMKRLEQDRPRAEQRAADVRTG